MTHSDQINELAAALAKAQGAIQGAKKDSDNPFFKSKYADLAAVWEACRMHLSANGLAVSQTLSADSDHVVITTLLMHTSGQWLQDALSLKPKDDGPQAFGSAATYGRRYSLAALVGVAPEDDDGNAAEARGKPITVEAKVAPKGFAEWEHDLAATAAEGLPALQAAWKQSKPEFRSYLTETNKAGLERLKALAAKVTPEATYAGGEVRGA